MKRNLEEPRKRNPRKRRKVNRVPVLIRVKPLGAGGGGGEMEALLPGCKSTFSFNRTCAWTDKKKFVSDGGIIPPEGDQGYTYDYVMGDLLEQFLSGIDVNVIAYGQTGSGKTHTLFGPPNYIKMAVKKDVSLEDLKGGEFGCVPRAAARMFEYVKEKEATGKFRISLSASLLEIHFMCLKDLLNKKVDIPINKKRSMPVGEATWTLDSRKKILKYLSMVETRTTGATLLNDTSSRSHCISAFTLDQYNVETEVLTTSKLQFFDLGGSERVEDAHGKDGSAHDSAAKMEGIYINASLLGLCLAVQSAVRKSKKKKKKKAKAKKKKFMDKEDTRKEVMVVLCSLLDRTWSGTASTKFLVMVSQAPRNQFNSEYSLDFGSKLRDVPMNPRKTAPTDIATRRRELVKTLKEHQAVLTRLEGFGKRNVKYIGIRKAYVRYCTFELKKLDYLTQKKGKGVKKKRKKLK